MKRKIEIGLLIAVIGLGIAALLLMNGNGHRSKDSSVQKREEITIRNVTKGRINYSIRPYNSLEEPEKKVLNAGAIHNYASKVTMDIMFERVGEDITRHLSPGKPYSFRYDEKNLIRIYEGSHGRKML